MLSSEQFIFPWNLKIAAHLDRLLRSFTETIFQCYCPYVSMLSVMYWLQAEKQLGVCVCMCAYLCVCVWWNNDPGSEGFNFEWPEIEKGFLLKSACLSVTVPVMLCHFNIRIICYHSLKTARFMFFTAYNFIVYPNALHTLALLKWTNKNQQKKNKTETYVSIRWGFILKIRKLSPRKCKGQVRSP